MNLSASSLDTILSSTKTHNCSNKANPAYLSTMTDSRKIPTKLYPTMTAHSGTPEAMTPPVTPTSILNGRSQTWLCPSPPASPPQALPVQADHHCFSNVGADQCRARKARQDCETGGHTLRLIHCIHTPLCAAEVGGLETTARLPRITWMASAGDGDVGVQAVCDECRCKIESRSMIGVGNGQGGRGSGGQMQVIRYVPSTSREARRRR